MTWEPWSFKAPTRVPHVKLMRVFHLGGLLILPYSVGCNGGGNPRLWAAFKERPREELLLLPDSSPSLLTLPRLHQTVFQTGWHYGITTRASQDSPDQVWTTCSSHLKQGIKKKKTKIKINRNQVEGEKKWWELPSRGLFWENQL